jgi:hypothetical protein
MDELFGNGQPNSFKAIVESDMRIALRDDYAKVARTPTWEFPKRWQRVSIGPIRVLNAEGDLRPWIVKLRVGERLSAEAEAVARDILKVARDIKIELVMRSPVGSLTRGYRYSAGRGPGGYKANHEIFLNNRKITTATRQTSVGEDAIAHVMNRVDYASVLEAPNYYRVYQDVLKWAVRRYGKDFDINLSFAPANAFGGSFVPGAKGKSSLLYRRMKSNFPVITIMPFGTMKRGAGRFTPIKRRSSRQRYWQF